MKNVNIKLEDDLIIIIIDKTKDFGPSKTGKTTIIASTEGNQKVEGTDLILGLNCYRKR